jgi:hypothetical protein
MKVFREFIEVKKILLLVFLLLTTSYVGAETVVYGFDGTGKNKSFGDKTNVYRFLEAYAPYGDSYYINGVGSNVPDSNIINKIVNLPGVVSGLGAKKNHE